MDHNQVGKYWDENADAWTKLSREGYDVYRDHLNTPAFLRMLPDVSGLHGLDIGCGEGANTRLLRERGAKMTAIDISEKFVHYAHNPEAKTSNPIAYAITSAVELPFPAQSFDFASAFMSLMDIPETESAIRETHRVLKPGGFLQFSISHPCNDTPHRANLRDENGRTYAIEIGDYFRNMQGEISEWLFSAAPEEAKQGLSPFKIPRFTHTLSEWFNLLIDCGFTIERVAEPYPDDDTVEHYPNLQDAQVVAYFLIVRVRKP